MAFHTLNGVLYFLETGAPVPAGAIPITDAYAAVLQTPTSAQNWAVFQAEAGVALVKTDSVAQRCFKAGQVFPLAWNIYATALRLIISTPSGIPSALPVAPPYPPGT